MAVAMKPSWQLSTLAGVYPAMIHCFRVLLILAAAASLAGCGVVAAPVRVTSAAVKIVPVAGDVVAAPLDVTADTID
jgi:hypothetical protein